ncbi:MAG: lytic transglycosylase domain-containing protein [Myxococcaceae bacterium]
MDQAPTLGTATEAALSPPVRLDAPTTTTTPEMRPRLFFASLALNGALAGGLVAAALGAHERFERLQQSNELVLARLEQTRTQLDGVATQSKTLAGGLSDVQQAVSSHAHEEALFLKMLILKPSLDHALGHRIATIVQQQCALFGQDPNLVLAIMATESDFDPKVRSNQGAVGLMQVMPHWKKVLGLEQDLTEPEVSIRAGIQILGFYQQMYRDPELALTAYNRGPGPVDGALVRGSSPANGYAAKVLGTYERLKGLDVDARP